MIELRVLGPISLKRADGSDVSTVLAQPKRLALLVYLAAPSRSGKHVHRKDSLVGMFWPELDQKHARAALRNALYFLRCALGSDVFQSRGDEEVGIDPEQFWCDAVVFDVAAAIGDHTTALQLYRGEMLEGVFVPNAQPFERWLDSQRLHRRLKMHELAFQRARRDAAVGRLQQALVWARRAQQMTPLNEEATRAVIALHYLMGDRASALEEFVRFQALLKSEHAVECSAETQRLVKAIREPGASTATISMAMSQIPGLRMPKRPSDATADLYNWDVLLAFVDKRLHLARRQGEQLAVVFVTFDRDTSFEDDTEASRVARSIASHVRDADLVAQAGPRAIAVLPSEGTSVNLPALLTRVRERMGQFGLNGRAHASAAWIDPRRSETSAHLLAEAIEHIRTEVAHS